MSGKKKPPRLTCLKPRVAPAPQRIKTHTTASIRKRGRAGVADRERIRRRDLGLCQECLRQGRYTEGAEVDHITALHLGGSDADTSKELLCRACHLAKTKRELST